MYQTLILPHFKKQLKKYIKKHRDLKLSLVELLENFDTRQHAHLGNNVYKARLRIKSVPRGKSKSFRVIILLVSVDDIIVPVALYFKGDQQDISKEELNEHLGAILFELKAEL